MATKTTKSIIDWIVKRTRGIRIAETSDLVRRQSVETIAQYNMV
jgi:hypothetical protein